MIMSTFVHHVVTRFPRLWTRRSENGRFCNTVKIERK